MTESFPFIHLRTHSAYSLAEGALKTKDLVDLCIKHNMPAVAVTDTGNLFGALEFSIEASKKGIQPIIGCQVRLGTEGHELVLLVQSLQGYQNLSALVSHSFLSQETLDQPYVSYEDLEKYHEGLIVLSGGIKGAAGQYLLHNQPSEAKASLKKLKSIFKDRFYIELQRHGLEEEERIEPAMIDLAYALDIPLVATNQCFFADVNMYAAHDALLCIAAGRYISETDRRRETPEHYFKSASQMQKLFADIPEAIQNSVHIAQRCAWYLEPINPILPAFETQAGRTEAEELAAQSEEGLSWRLEHFVLPKHNIEPNSPQAMDFSKPYQERLAYELSVIAQMGFEGYFLIVSDFIKWAKDNKIPVGPGRGSGAGSVVAWVLKITDLDPLEFGLLFERFLNPERVSMPDFDIDFCQERRDEVISYVQQKYGYDRVAQIITFGKLQARAVVRDVGRVLQMPYGQVDRIAKMIPSNPANPVTLQEALDQDPDLRLEMKREATTERLIEIALRLEGLYRHASTHAAGVVIGDRPLQELVPLYRDQKSSMPVTQFNMKYVEQAGLVKFDFLGLKTMTVIQKTVDMIRDSGGADIDILRIPFDDEKTYDLMTRGQTVGVFQLESTGMRDTLRRMRPNRLEDIIALVSLYRPGPMDNIPTYVARKDGREEPDYMHPILRPYLEETYGIMIYQEQVMQAAQALAGYTLGGADLLRRAMGKKIKEEMDAQRALFAKGAADTHQVPPAKAEEIFEQINKFAGYGFNKSHAAAYAVISYWTGWLKANYPLEFMAASMTLDKGNTDKLSVFRQDLVKMEIPLLIPDLNKSDVDFVVEGDGVRYALSALKSVGEQAMVTLCTIRAEKGVYKNIQDFASRIGSGVLNKRQIEALAAAGAFESLGYHRAEVYNEAEKVLRYAQEKAIERESGQVSLFGIAEDEVDSGLGLNLSAAAKWDALDQLKHEFDAVGFYLSAHPLDGKMEMLKARKMILYSDMVDTLNDKPAAYFTMAGVLMKKQIKMSKQGKKFAFLQFSDPSAVYELMVFSEILAGIQDDLQIGNAFTLKVLGEVKDDQIRLTAQSMNLLKDTTDSEKSARIKRIDIQLNHVKGAHYLKQYLLDQTGEAKIPVHVSYPLNGDSVMIALPPHYVIKDANIMPLQSHPHIVQVDVVYV